MKTLAFNGNNILLVYAYLTLSITLVVKENSNLFSRKIAEKRDHNIDPRTSDQRSTRIFDWLLVTRGL
jgi:hypothetical protein